jgi:hypothetical protein
VPFGLVLTIMMNALHLWMATRIPPVAESTTLLLIGVGLLGIAHTVRRSR